MISIRAVEPGDLAVIGVHRHRMFGENGFAEDKLAAMDGPFAAWLAQRLRDGTYFGFLAEDAGSVVAGIGLFVLDFPPHPLHPTSAQRGYILNVFVEPEYRGRDLAKALMERAEEVFRARGVVFEVLHASPMGRPMYEKLGWELTSEMRKSLG